MCGSYLADTGRMVCEKCEKPKTELKPCPFCGGKDVQRVWKWDVCYVKCQACGARASRHWTTDEAIEAWNMRAEDGKSVCL